MTRWNFIYKNINKNILTKSQLQKNRSGHGSCSIKKGVLKNFAKFTRKHLCRSLLFNKAIGLRSATLLKKRL